jgi:hypothetical protein
MTRMSVNASSQVVKSATNTTNTCCFVLLHELRLLWDSRSEERKLTLVRVTPTNGRLSLCGRFPAAFRTTCFSWIMPPGRAGAQFVILLFHWESIGDEDDEMEGGNSTKTNNPAQRNRVGPSACYHRRPAHAFRDFLGCC